MAQRSREWRDGSGTPTPSEELSRSDSYPSRVAPLPESEEYPLKFKEPCRGHLEAAGVGLDWDEDRPTRQPPPGATFGRGPAWGLGRQFWSESNATSDLSGTDVQYSDIGDTDSKCRFESDCHTPIPLLKADPPASVAGLANGYFVRLRRASLKQRYGVAFDAAETRDRRLSTINIAEDLPHLGITKGDAVVSLNRAVPGSVSECREILEQAMTIDLVLQRKQPSRSQPKGASGGVLLSVTRASVTDERIGEFRLTMQRSSQRQRFGLVFEAVLPKRRGEDPIITVADDMPHLALQRADRLVSLNGVRIRSKKTCSQILGTAMRLHLVLRREHGSLGGLEHQVQSVDKAEEVQCATSPLFGCLSCMQSPEEEPSTVAKKDRPPQELVVGHDAMGGPLDTGCGLFPACVAQPQADYEQHVSYANGHSAAPSPPPGHRAW